MKLLYVEPGEYWDGRPFSITDICNMADTGVVLLHVITDHVNTGANTVALVHLFSLVTFEVTFDRDFLHVYG